MAEKSLNRAVAKRRAGAAWRRVAGMAAAAVALTAMFLAPGPAQATHDPDLIPQARGAEFRQLNLRLFDAAEKGDTAMIADLLAEGASVEARDRFGNTALLRAARTGRTRTIKVLLEAGSGIDRQNLIGSTALLRAATTGKNRTVKALAAAGAEVNLANN